MRALLDANFLIALFDIDHVFHQRARQSFRNDCKDGWASCPITQNALVRILTNRGYSRINRFSVDNVTSAFQTLAKTTDHRFWHDDISITDEKIFNFSAIHSSSQITDAYLLALSVQNKGRFVTFDRRITVLTVRSARSENLVILD